MKIFSQSVSILLVTLLVAGQLPAEASLQIRVLDPDTNTALAGSSAGSGFTVQVSDNTGAAVSDAAVVMRLPDDEATGSFTDGTRAAVAYTDEKGQAHVAGIQWGTTPGVVGIRITATKGTIHAGLLLEETLTAPAVPTAPLSAVPKSAEAAPVMTHVAAPAETEPVAAAPRPTVSVRQPGEIDPVDRLQALRANSSAAAPSVSVVNGPTGVKLHGGGSKTKWIILAVAVAAGAGVAIAMASRGKSSSSSSTSSSGVSIGSPTVSVGAP